MTNINDSKRSRGIQRNTTEELRRRLANGEASNSLADGIAAIANFAHSLILHFSDGSTVEVADTDFAMVARTRNAKHLPDMVQTKAREGLDVVAVTFDLDDDCMEHVRGVTRSILGNDAGQQTSR